MSTRYTQLLFMLSLSLPLSPAVAQPIVSHELTVRLEPERGFIAVVDRLTLPREDPAFPQVVFSLHEGMAPRLVGEGRLVPFSPAEGGWRRWRAQLPPDAHEMTLAYEGTIDSPLDEVTTDIGMSGHATSGTIGAQGVFLSGASGWYPSFGAARMDFSLTVTLPSGWMAISQGRRERFAQHDGSVIMQWVERQPQDEIYLVAGRFTPYRASVDGVEALVFLRQPDEALAEHYLSATRRYLPMYSALLGAYPYSKFALVENFWESGYGMPSFTLLGPRVIRLPFIADSSYPHEILHNWWGNGVYVDYATGNWSEGLTAYLADHLIQERRGEGANYRRDTLQKYAEYVAEDGEMALADFRARHGEASQAVGYGKALMLFHMLRRQLGDAVFVEGLRRFYRNNRFQTAGYADLRRAMESAGKTDLGAFFAQWVERTGAPQLMLDPSTVATSDTPSHTLRFDLLQVQPGLPYRLRVPIAVQIEGQPESTVKIVEMAEKHTAVRLVLPGRPLRVTVDPRFDVFRRLHPDELPPALGRLFGAERLWLILPSGAPAPLRDGYQALARQWQGSDPRVRIVWDNALDEWPDSGAIWLLGWENRLSQPIRHALRDRGAQFAEKEVTYRGSRLRQSVVLAERGPGNQPAGWLATSVVDALPGLARKVPHYSKYSYLSFSGSEPSLQIKGQWQDIRSPLSIALSDDAPPLQLQPSSPLVPRQIR